MMATDPPSPLLVPPPGAGTDQDAAAWAARAASWGEEPYGPAKISRNLAIIEMSPHVPTPAVPGCVWLPIEVFSRRGLRDRMMRRIAIAVWRASVWNTWRSHYRLYCAGACVAFFLAALHAISITSSAPVRMSEVERVKMLVETFLLFTPAVVLGILTVAASKEIRYAIPAKVLGAITIFISMFVVFVAISNLIRQLMP